MAVYFCMNCNHEFYGANYYEYRLNCPHCLVELVPVYYSCVVPLNDFGSKDAPIQSYNQLLCYPTYDHRQMINSPLPVPYGHPFEQMLPPPHVESNGMPHMPHQPLPAPSYSNSSNGSIVHSAEGSEVHSIAANELSPVEFPGNNHATECLKSLAAMLKGNIIISQTMRKKLSKLINCPLNDEENQVIALNICFSIGERVMFELTLENQNLQDSISNLLASIRSKGCQFLGLPMQDEILKLILQALENGEDLTRKELVTFVLERLQQHRQTSKKKIGDVVQLLYRACCFNITKRTEMSALMQLKENLRDYKTLREQHDAQVVQIATDAGIRISNDNWALLLYNDVSYKRYIETIIAKLKSKATFDELVKQFEMFAQRRSSVVHLKRFCLHLKNLAALDTTEAETAAAAAAEAGEENVVETEIMPIEEKVARALDEVYQIVREISEYKQQYKNRNRELVGTGMPQQQQHQHQQQQQHEQPSPTNGGVEQQRRNNQSTKSYKLRLCRNVALYRNCPRGNNCNFLHSRAEYNCNRNIS